MPYFHIITFGCKVNQCDTAALTQEFSGLGWRAAPRGAVPDLALINTCTVTARADQQARQAIRRLAREHPGLPLWVTGCYAQRAPQEVAALPGVRAVFGNREKPRLLEICRELLPPPEAGGAGPHPPSAGTARPAIHVSPYSPAEPFHPWRVHTFPGRTRAWMKIQEGCRHHCSYCIVPQVRGPRRSMALGEVVAALPELAAAGYQEVVLTGVDLGQYGQDLDPAGNLAALVARLKESARPLRVRLSSLEPQEVTADLLRELATWEDFCPHFHLPLQSGAPEVLAAMGRPYRTREFRDLCLTIHRIFPQAALGLDILVGFPGETAAHFAATRELVAALPAAYLHVFPYSPRPGTPAALLAPESGQEVLRRARIMRELGRRKREEFQRAQLGRIREVLVEGPCSRPGWLRGLSDNYLRVLVPGAPDCRNQRLRVRFLEVQGEMIIGTVAP